MANDSALINSSFGQDGKMDQLPMETTPAQNASATRPNLLEEIQAGCQLRKVQREEQAR
jgi:hypothetical protein